jgi:hypothetical protein
VFFVFLETPWKEDVGVLVLHCGGDVRMWIAVYHWLETGMMEQLGILQYYTLTIFL